ncbi:MAG: BamA/TamA family outer membrane protein [Candidatus Cloacimonetes bacterium]|nr:BamA/TamA family outer membrane protein [Candidatus Cloacimonadota bacterium]
MKSIYTILAMLWLVLPLSAQLNVAAYPYLAYSSETRAFLGAFSFVRYDFASEDDPLSPNMISLLGNTIYSQNRQFLLALIPGYELSGFSLESSIVLKNWPDTFYGIGNETVDDVHEGFTAESYSAESTFRYYISQRLSVALQSDIGKHVIHKVQGDGMLENSSIIGKKDGQFSGLGIVLKYDSSDKSYFPRGGTKLEIRQIWFDPALGSDYGWHKQYFDARTYIPLGDKHVLAMQTNLEINEGDTPFYKYPELGKYLRAYDSKRFIDDVSLSARIEQRSFPFEIGFWRRLGFVAFAESGRVAQSFADLDITDLHWSMGAGLRFSILPEERLNLRADFGFGADSFNFIINAREVF